MMLGIKSVLREWHEIRSEDSIEKRAEEIVKFISGE